MLWRIFFCYGVKSACFHVIYKKNTPTRTTPVQIVCSWRSYYFLFFWRGSCAGVGDIFCYIKNTPKNCFSLHFKFFSSQRVLIFSIVAIIFAAIYFTFYHAILTFFDAYIISATRLTSVCTSHNWCCSKMVLKTQSYAYSIKNNIGSASMLNSAKYSR